MEEDDDLMSSAERRSPAALASPQPAALNYSNFNGTKSRMKTALPIQLTMRLIILINQDQFKFDFPSHNGKWEVCI